MASIKQLEREKKIQEKGKWGDGLWKWEWQCSSLFRKTKASWHVWRNWWTKRLKAVGEQTNKRKRCTGSETECREMEREGPAIAGSRGVCLQRLSAYIQSSKTSRVRHFTHLFESTGTLLPAGLQPSILSSSHILSNILCLASKLCFCRRGSCFLRALRRSFISAAERWRFSPLSTASGVVLLTVVVEWMTAGSGSGSGSFATGVGSGAATGVGSGSGSGSWWQRMMRI